LLDKILCGRDFSGQSVKEKVWKYSGKNIGIDFD